MKFFTKNNFSDEIKEIVLDKTIFSANDTLKDYFLAKKVKVDQKEFQKFIQNVNEELLEQVRYLAYLLFYAMSRSGKWGFSGEQAIRNSFARIVLDIPLSESITYDHTMAFNEAVSNAQEKYNLNLLSEQVAFETYKNYKLTFLGEVWKGDDILLSKYLRFCGSDLCISFGQFQTYMQYTLGQAKLVNKGQFDIVTFQKEVMRTPNVIMARAANNINTNIFVRMESLKTIFYQKWCQVFEKDYYLQSRIESDPMWAISQFIKERALSLYGVQQASQMESIASEFLKDTRETITFHELGHGVMFSGIVSAEAIGLTQSTVLTGTETIFNTLWEFMADFAPEIGKIHGPMYHMTVVYANDKQRAERLFWTYFSDIWFYDTDDQYMTAYSDVMVLILLKYVRKDLSVDFEGLKKDLSYDPTFKPDRKEMGVFQKITEMLVWDAEGIREIIKSAPYYLVQEETYQSLQIMVSKKMKEHYPQYESDSSDYQLLYWQWYINLLKRYSKEGYQRLNDYIKQQERKTLMKLFVISAGKKRAEAYGFDHRKYIVDRCRALGMVPSGS